MKLEVAKFLQEATENAGESCDLREDYSGRGMYGRTTAGIAVESEASLWGNVMQYIQDNMDEENFREQFSELEFPQFHTDSMGMQTIIY